MDFENIVKIVIMMVNNSTYINKKKTHLLPKITRKVSRYNMVCETLGTGTSMY
jgi:hypothetical protein